MLFQVSKMDIEGNNEDIDFILNIYDIHFQKRYINLKKL